MNLGLSGKRVLVSGASQGIGLACALSFAREGARPVLLARDAAKLERAAVDIHAQTGVAPSWHAIDLASDDAAARVVELVGDIDILVNNAGAIPGGSLETVDDARWHASWELKVYGYIALVRAYLPRMRAARSGVIANIIGMAGVAPREAYLCGSTANAALVAFTRALGGASPRQGVRVFGVNPSQTGTPRIEQVMRAQAAERLGHADRWEELLQDLPFGRLQEPEEVADMVVFGCSPRAGYLSGTVIDLDGGQSTAG
ncbi:MAG: short-chain dehydrogenase/reductase [Pigmentiphaga sp.]|uniref:short-chain dehydrogenase/reductase n=1 Tax=Pigmentiphaga sp. TaxID=1977564 RepID=UPI0029BD4EA7|nr:short-chain dehydrogenase/reductase [Pigmentiphaga sp.]MDX3905950.1 short-chain dehydrogenase/reductase [Pigmentiphaga sp.]